MDSKVLFKQMFTQPGGEFDPTGLVKLRIQKSTVK